MWFFYAPEGRHIKFELSIRPSFRHKSLNSSKMHTVWQIFFKLGMHVACDEFYILWKVKVIRSKVKVTEVMADVGALCYANTSLAIYDFIALFQN